MKIIRQAILLLGISIIGEFMNKVLHVPLPGSVLGLILLLTLLLTGLIQVRQIEELTNFLMNHLAIFFVPSAVGLMTVAGMLKSSWVILLVISTVSSVMVMTVTAVVVQFVRRRKL